MSKRIYFYMSRGTLTVLSSELAASVAAPLMIVFLLLLVQLSGTHSDDPCNGLPQYQHRKCVCDCTGRWKCGNEKCGTGKW